MAVIDVDKVSKSFGTHLVLDDVSLEVGESEAVAVIGRSGSGKSTLLRCINGLEAIDSGRIAVAGHEVTRSDRELRALRQDVGMVFQSYNLFPHLTVERNIMLAPTVVKGVPEEKARETARRVLADVGLLDKIDAYPDELSGGQQQRVAIARSLAMSPKVMLFDEVTSALDPELTGEVLKVMADLALGGMTMMLVTHEMGFAREMASRVVFMHAGKPWEVGPPEALFEAPQTPELQQFLGSVL